MIKLVKERLYIKSQNLKNNSFKKETQTDLEKEINEVLKEDKQIKEEVKEVTQDIYAKILDKLKK